MGLGCSPQVWALSQAFCRVLAFSGRLSHVLIFVDTIKLVRQAKYVE